MACLNLLAVGSSGSVLAEVMTVEEALGYAFGGWVEGEGVVGHLGYSFEDDGVVGGIVCVLAPDEGSVAVDQTGGNG